MVPYIVVSLMAVSGTTEIMDVQPSQIVVLTEQANTKWLVLQPSQLEYRTFEESSNFVFSSACEPENYIILAIQNWDEPDFDVKRYVINSSGGNQPPPEDDPEDEPEPEPEPEPTETYNLKETTYQAAITSNATRRDLEIYEENFRETAKLVSNGAFQTKQEAGAYLYRKNHEKLNASSIDNLRPISQEIARVLEANQQSISVRDLASIYIAIADGIKLGIRE